MVSPPQTALLSADFEFKDTTEEYDSKEQDKWLNL